MRPPSAAGSSAHLVASETVRLTRRCGGRQHPGEWRRCRDPGRPRSLPYDPSLPGRGRHGNNQTRGCSRRPERQPPVNATPSVTPGATTPRASGSGCSSSNVSSRRPTGGRSCAVGSIKRASISRRHQRESKAPPIFLLPRSTCRLRGRLTPSACGACSKHYVCPVGWHGGLDPAEAA